MPFEGINIASDLRFILLAKMTANSFRQMQGLDKYSIKAFHNLNSSSPLPMFCSRYFMGISSTSML